MSSENTNLQLQIFQDGAINDSKSYPIYLNKVEVNGGDSLSRQFFSKLLSPLVKESDYTLVHLIEKVNQSANNLRRTGVFGEVKPSLHADYTHVRPLSRSYNLENPIVTNVIFDLESKDSSTGNFSLGFNDEDNLIVNLGYDNNNFNHNAEAVKFGVNYRPYKPSERLVSTMRLESFLKCPAFRFVLDLHNAHDNNQTSFQHARKALGGVMGIFYANEDGSISVFNGFSLIRRSTSLPEEISKDQHQSFGGDFLKSSIVTRLMYNKTRTMGDYINDGIRSRLNNEIAIDQKQTGVHEAQNTFVKTEGSLDLYKSLMENRITANIFMNSGIIFGGVSSDHVHVSDRFYLGGSDSFKGFSRNAVNEEGGLQFYKFGATAFGKIPSFLRPANFSSPDPMRMYVTGMVGNVGYDITREKGVMSVGIGLRYTNQMVKMDAGYYFSQRLGSSSDHGVKDGFKLELTLGGIANTQ
ncbi:hypothetical protein OXX80_012165 [Metschnikowia pulcherrima]